MGANAHYGNSASTTVHITVTNNEVSDICFFFYVFYSPFVKNGSAFKLKKFISKSAIYQINIIYIKQNGFSPL